MCTRLFLQTFIYISFRSYVNSLLTYSLNKRSKKIPHRFIPSYKITRVKFFLLFYFDRIECLQVLYHSFLLHSHVSIWNRSHFSHPSLKYLTCFHPYTLFFHKKKHPFKIKHSTAQLCILPTQSISSPSSSLQLLKVQEVWLVLLRSHWLQCRNPVQPVVNEILLIGTWEPVW